MVKRVGFGRRKEKPENRSASPAPSTRQPNTNNVADMSAGARVFQLGFIAVWLVGWSVGIGIAFVFLFSGDGFSTAFLTFWIVVASIFWIIAVRRLIALVRGK